MKCRRCGNEDPAYFYKGHKGFYCRKCIRFSRLLLEEEPCPADYEIAIGTDEYRFDYKLTQSQEIASKECAACLERSDVLLHCVCGAGKTEIAVRSISQQLAKGKKVAYAIARKEVVIELQKRFALIFPKADVIGVYGGHHEQLTGDLIVCTCHQLHRYYRTFDLLILDEVDAFPLKGNETLMNISLNACKGRVIFSTATVDKDLQKILDRRNYKKVELFVRPSGKPLILPEVICRYRYLLLFPLFRILNSLEGQCIIFLSSKKLCSGLYRLFSLFFSCTYVYSDLPQRDRNIRDFKDGKYRYIFATTVLERGITIRDVSVIILHISAFFDESNLIQMLGRVGRGMENDQGRSFLIAEKKDIPIRKTLAYLKKANESI